jgi:hypothetical protein
MDHPLHTLEEIDRPSPALHRPAADTSLRVPAAGAGARHAGKKARKARQFWLKQLHTGTGSARRSRWSA